MKFDTYSLGLTFVAAIYKVKKISDHVYDNIDIDNILKKV